MKLLLRPLAGIIPQQLIGFIPACGKVELTLPSQKTIAFQSDGSDFIATQFFWKGWQGFEPETVRVFGHLLKRGGVVFDIGANTGLYALVGGKENTAAQVFAFEPHPDVCGLLRQNIQLNQLANVEAIEAAVTDKAGEIELHVPIGVMKPISSSLDASFRRHCRTIAVRGVTIDGFASERKLDRVDLVKIDVEGAEMQVLRGMEHTLKEFAPFVMCEVLPGSEEAAMGRFFEERGYAFYWIAADGLVAKQEVRADLSGACRNYLFAPKDRVGCLDELFNLETAVKLIGVDAID